MAPDVSQLRNVRNHNILLVRCGDLSRRELVIVTYRGQQSFPLPPLIANFFQSQCTMVPGDCGERAARFRLRKKEAEACREVQMPSERHFMALEGMQIPPPGAHLRDSQTPPGRTWGPHVSVSDANVALSPAGDRNCGKWHSCSRYYYRTLRAVGEKW